MLSEVNSGGLVLAILGVAISAGLAVITGGLSLAVAGILAGLGIIGVSVASIVTDLQDGIYDDCLLTNYPNLSNNSLRYVGEYLNKLWIESPINANFIHSGESDYTKRLIDFSSGTGDIQSAMQEYMLHKLTEEDTDGNTIARKYPLVESLLYNDGYTFKNVSTNDYLAPTESGICEPTCRPNTIIWSEKAFDDDNSDAMLIYSPLNRTLVGTHAGPITTMKYDRGKLFITTTSSAFMLSPNPRTLQTDTEDVILGVGDFLSIPEQEFIKTDYGYAGCQHSTSAINTPYGYIYPDALAGDVFMFTDSITPISYNGMKHWFKQNLPIKLYCSIPQEVACNNEILLSNVGLRATYDPLHTRYILSKIDYEPINFKGLNLDITTEGLYFSDNQWWNVDFRKPNGIEQVTFGDPNHFSNESWTISYNLTTNSWTSFHSYIPDQLFNDYNTFYSSIGSSVYKHNYGNYQTYYGVKYDFIVEYVVNEPATHDLHAIHYYSKSTTDNVSTPDVTFDRFVVRNSCQSTGLQKLTYLDKSANPYGNRIGWSNDEKDVILTEHNYRVSAIRALSTSNEVITDEWSNLQNYYEANGYIDHIPTNIDYNTNQHLLADMKDKYHYIRLFANNELFNANIQLNITQSKNFYSFN